MKRQKNGGIRRNLKLKGAEPPAVRKAFVQIIEVAIAALLLVLVLPVFFSWMNVKQDWARHDLIASGNGVVKSLEAAGNLTHLINNTQEFIREMETVKPANVKYSIYVEGSPKPRINMACACTDIQLAYAKSVFTAALLDSVFVNFTIEKINLNSLPSIPGNYDVTVFIDYADADWTSQKQKISDFISGGRGIIAIQKASSNADFMNMLNLSSSVGTASYMNFSSSYPQETNIEKYFLGFGFDVAAADDGTGTYKGTWYLWESAKSINSTGTTVGIENLGIVLPEGRTFSMSGAPDGGTYFFRVKKIWPDKSGVIFQALNKTFVFKDFRDASENKVNGNSIIKGETSATYSLMAKNGAAVWISDFPNSDEYRALAKSAAATLSENFYVVSPLNVKNKVNVYKFINLCCDAPRMARLTFSFWHVF